MSESSNGPNWWLAGDGKWYPPRHTEADRVRYVTVAVDAKGHPTAGMAKRIGATLLDMAIIVGAALVLAISLKISTVASSLPIGIVYVTITVGAMGRTVGNLAASTMVVDAQTAEPIGYGRAALRALIQAVLLLTCVGWILDYLWPLWDERDQTIHDKATGSLVVNIEMSHAGLSSDQRGA